MGSQLPTNDRTPSTVPPFVSMPSNSPSPLCEIDHQYMEGYGCLPVAERNGQKMTYIVNKEYKAWGDHEQAANLCGGHLASILDESENNKVRAYINMHIPGDYAWLGG